MLRAVGRLEWEAVLVVSELPLTKYYAIGISFWPRAAALGLFSTGGPE